MPYPAPFAAQTEREARMVELARSAALIAAEHAPRHDRAGTFPVEGLATLADNGYLALVLPSGFGGEGATVAEMVLGNLELARGDASLALVVGMHCALLGRVRDAGVWPAGVFERVARDVCAARSGNGALINSLASEPEMGSPSRGGLPATQATGVDGGFVLNGRKSFSSGSTVLRWGVVSAAIGVSEREPYLGSFLVPMSTAGVRIEPSWDTLGMRATASHTLVLEEVFVPADAELPRDTPAPDPLPHERAWSLTVAAVYLGVAEAARDFALGFARSRKPTALGGKSISTLPSIRDRAGRMDLALFEARGLLVSTARMWSAAPSVDMLAALAAAKVVASNTAVSVAEQAMRLVGGSAMDRSLPLERHYRDVRGGLHHPPQDDAAIALFAREALDD
ncbi:MAG: acyl-CoA/acyl-ACP dehydrogenase [Chloroflexi bacterium]|nr:acyl-CoA/acyl-ACP dehydrogenase [Chloroflexota bacterium]